LPQIASFVGATLAVALPTQSNRMGKPLRLPQIASFVGANPCGCPSYKIKSYWANPCGCPKSHHLYGQPLAVALLIHNPIVLGKPFRLPQTIPCGCPNNQLGQPQGIAPTTQIQSIRVTTRVCPYKKSNRIGANT